jgi:hypothetical protein
MSSTIINDQCDSANYELDKLQETLNIYEESLLSFKKQLVEHETNTITDNLEYFIEDSEKEYWGKQPRPSVEYLTYCISTYKSFCMKVDNLRYYVDIRKLCEALDQSKTLLTELIGERFRLEYELSLLDTGGQIIEGGKFPSNELISDTKYESFHNKQVIKLSRAIVSDYLTNANLMHINRYLYNVKTKIQQMSASNHKIATFISNI